MKKNILLLLFFLLPLSVMAGGTLKDAEKAYQKAIREYGEHMTCTLRIKGEKSDYVYDCLWSHQCVVVSFFNIYYTRPIEEYVFLSYANRQEFEQNMLDLTFGTTYANLEYNKSQLKQRGSAFLFQEEPEPRFEEFTNIMWTGNVKNGKLDGTGAGVVFVYNNDKFEKYFVIDGEFKEGVPCKFQRHEQIRKNEKGFYCTKRPGDGAFSFVENYHGRDAFYYLFTDTPGVVLVDCPNRGFGFYDTDLKAIRPFKLYSKYDDFKDGYRRVVEQRSENGTDIEEVYFLDYRGKQYTKAEMEAGKNGRYVIRENNSDDYSVIPEYPESSDTRDWLPDTWNRWLADGKIPVVDCYYNSKLECDDTQKYKSQSTPFLLPDDQVQTFVADNIRYFAYENNEVQANYFYNTFHGLTGQGRGNEDKSGGDLYIPSTVTNPNTGQKYTVTSIGTFAKTNYRFIYIPKTVRQCGRPNCQGVLSEAFAYCKYLEGVVLEEGHPGINWGSSTFQSCSNLKSIPYNMSTACINSGMFDACDKLRTIKVPVGVKELGAECFSYHLDTLSIPNTVTKISSNAFKNISSVKVLHVPLNAYAEICRNRNFDGNKACLAANEIRIRDEKYDLCTVEDIYLRQCELLEAYYNRLLAANTSYEDVKLNSSLVDDFVALFDHTDLDINNKVPLAKELQGEHKLIGMLRSSYIGDCTEFIAWAEKPSNIGFTLLHEKAISVLEQKEADYKREQKQIADKNAEKAFKSLEKLVDAFGGSGGGSSSSSSGSSKPKIDTEVDVNYETVEKYHEVIMISRPHYMYELKKTIRFNDGTTADIYKVKNKEGYYWGGKTSYKTEADAAAAAYFYKKYELVRKKGKGEEHS